jgi:predicted ATPase/DNA-binding SARP family transcriptional activator
MRIGVLGPLEVSADGKAVDVGGFRLRALLIRLALDPGSVVTPRALAEALWPDGGPDNPAPALHSLVSRLRRALPGREVLRSEPAGYRLDLPADSVDAACFERLAGQGRRSLRAGHPDAALRQLTQALALWRGDPLADVAALPYAAAAAVRLEEVRLGAIEDRLEAELATGPVRPASLPELDRLIAAHPLRERLRGLHVRMLDADGRQAEALAAFEAYRKLLADELGADPGPELRELHLKVLREGTSRAAARGNLRTPLAGFVGREPELRLIAERLRDGRLVTLVGPGGVGKTRLATTAAAAVGAEVWLVRPAAVSGLTPPRPATSTTNPRPASVAASVRAEPAPVTEPRDVALTVAGVMGLRISGDPVTALAEALSARETLLILDGCEHVVDATARLAEELLGRCPPLRVLATSREPLGIEGEALCPVPPLPPEAAVRLFTARAQAVRPDFSPTVQVAEICARLDGLPLAIELAAARLRSMPLDRLASRLDDRFRLLTGGSRTAPHRHRTLRGMVEWSWDLLDETGREAAERAAVFPAAFTVEAAEHVGIAEEALHALVDKSLLHLDGDRYRMLDTIREYGLARLRETGRLRAARAAHAAWFLDLAEQAEPHLRGADQSRWLARLATERDNLLAALRTACDAGDADTAVRLGAALAMFWTVRGEHAEGVARLGVTVQMAGGPQRARSAAIAGYLLNALFAGELPTATATIAAASPTSLPGTSPDMAYRDPADAFAQAMLALATSTTANGLAALEPHLSEADPWTRAMLWLARSFLHGTTGDIREARADLSISIAAFRQCGERWGLSMALMSQAAADIAGDAYDEAIAALEEAEALAHALGTHDELAVWLAMTRIHTGQLDLARTRLLALTGDPLPPPETGTVILPARRVATARLALADVARCGGDLGEAARQLRLAGERDDTPYRAMYTAVAGQLAVATGDLGTASRRLAEALDLAAAMPDPPMAARVGVGVADLLARRGAPERAAEVLGAAAAVRGGPDTRHPDVARLMCDLLTSPDCQAAYKRGRDLDQAAALFALRAV